MTLILTKPSLSSSWKSHKQPGRIQGNNVEVYITPTGESINHLSKFTIDSDRPGCVGVQSVPVDVVVCSLVEAGLIREVCDTTTDGPLVKISSLADSLRAEVDKVTPVDIDDWNARTLALKLAELASTLLDKIDELDFGREARLALKASDKLVKTLKQDRELNPELWLPSTEEDS